MSCEVALDHQPARCRPRSGAMLQLCFGRALALCIESECPLSNRAEKRVDAPGQCCSLEFAMPQSLLLSPNGQFECYSRHMFLSACAGIALHIPGACTARGTREAARRTRAQVQRPEAQRHTRAVTRVLHTCHARWRESGGMCRWPLRQDGMSMQLAPPRECGTSTACSPCKTLCSISSQLSLSRSSRQALLLT